MLARDLDRHTHVGRKVTVQYGTSTWTFALHNLETHDGLVYLYHQRHAAIPVRPDADVEVRT